MEEIQDTSGFYLYQDGGLAFAPNFVEHKDYQIYRDQKDTYTYPIHGWHWFENENEAKTFFNIPILQPEQTYNSFL